MTKKEKRDKYMKWLKEYIMKEFTFVKEWKDKNGHIVYLFIKDDNFYHIYEEKDEVYMQEMGPVNNMVGDGNSFDKTFFNNLKEIIDEK